MLSRILEPEAMDTPEEARDYDAMDHAQVNRVFVTDLLFTAAEAGLNVDSVPEDASGYINVLDLGAGTAQIPIELCRRAPAVRVLAIDLAVEMLNLARYNVEIASLRDRIQLARVDAKELPYPDSDFAAVISNSIVHHIPEPRSALAEAIRVTARGGLLFFRDLVRPESEAGVSRLVDLHAADANEHQRALFAASLRAALTVEEVRELLISLGVNEPNVRATSDRHWTWVHVKSTPFE